MAENFYPLFLKARGGEIEVRLNDIVMLHTPERLMTIQSKANMFLVTGKNEIHVSVEKPAAASSNPEVYINLYLWEYGTPPETKKEVCHYSWPSQKEPFREKNKSEESFTFDIQDSFSPWSWENAQTFQKISESEKKEIIALMETWRNSLREKDMEKISSLLTWKTKDAARGLYMSEEELLASQKEFFGSFFADPNWELEPIVADSLDFQLQGKGRLVAVSKKGGEPLLISAPKTKETFAMPVMVARLENAWSVVR